jgi:hypothetical protein
VKTYSDALKHLKDLENFALTRNDSDLLETIFRARMMTEKHAYKSTGYIQKTLFNYWKKSTVISVIKYFVLSACVVFSDCRFLATV